MMNALAGLIISLTTAFSTPGQERLPGTAPLVMENDPAAAMVEDIHKFLDRETVQAAGRRGRFWKRDYASPEAHGRSLAANRERLRKIIGAVDARSPVTEMRLD